MTAAALFDRAVPRLRQEARRLEPTSVSWGDLIAIVSGAALPEPLVLVQPSDEAIAMLRRHSDESHAELFVELDRLAVEFPDLARVVLNTDDSWSVATLEWSLLQ